MENKILLVEGNKITSNILKFALRDFGYFVDVANTEEKALELGKKGDYFAILVDVKIPGVDGYKICYEIKRFRKKSKLIAMTGYDAIYGSDKCINAGFNNFFPKPVDTLDLIRISRNAIERKSIW